MNFFITGGTTGIGLALAELYLSRGNKVGVCGRDLSKIPHDLLDKYKGLLFTYQLDVIDRQAQKNTVLRFIAEAGGLDVMIANAGRSVGNKSRIPDFGAAKDIIETNVLGVLYSFESCMEYFLSKKQGHIVAISSVAGFVGLPGAGAYSASKAAVLRLCESWAIDFKEQNIAVSCICPGFIDTPLTKKNDHSMPFLMSAENGAKLIADAISNKKELYIFPWQMRIVITILDKIPRFLYRKLMSLRYLNYSKKG